jgi:hypothetical protein
MRLNGWIAALALSIVPACAHAQIGGAFGGSSSGPGPNTDLLVNSVTENAVVRRVRCWFFAQAANGALPISPCGAMSLTLAGGLSAIFDGNQPFTQMDVSATSGNKTIFTFPAGLFCGKALPSQRWYVRTATAISTMRIWVGLSSNISGTDNPTASTAAFRYSTAAGDTNWMACTRRVANGSTTCVSTGVPVVADTKYDLGVDCSVDPICVFTVNGAVTNTVNGVTTLSPDTGGIQANIYIETLAAVARTFYFSRGWVEIN